jgi:6-phosphofructokinase 1
LADSAQIRMITPTDLSVRTLGRCTVESPIQQYWAHAREMEIFVSDEEKILLDDSLNSVATSIARNESLTTFELAGPRRNLFFDPANSRCAIVTCGGLCPGINDVIRGIVMQAYLRYGVRTIFGIQCGYEGLIKEYGHPILNLTPESVENIHSVGGSVLGTSRGPQDASQIVERLCELSVNVLFIVGGDGTLRGANQIASEAQRLNYPISIVGIPKTIDNDIMFTDKSFGYETACAAAVEAIKAAHAEARTVRNGVGLVKLMGRHSGFIACSAALATSEVHFVLIPEVSFTLEGENGFLEVLQRRVQQSGYALIVVAEGAGQELFDDSDRDTDLSGNVTLKDIGLLLKKHIEKHSKRHSLNVKFKYIDPSYMIRGVRANPQDAAYCVRLAQNAVHAAMAGKTGIAITCWHGHYVHVPIRLAIAARKQVDPKSDLWHSVIESTGQPPRFFCTN